MKKLYKLLLGLSVIFMVACGSSYEKNPHLSKINEDVTVAKMQIKEKSYNGFTSDSKPEEKEYGADEEKLVDDILHTKYDNLSIYQVIFEISAQLDSSCDVIVLYNEHLQMGGVHFIWNEKEDMVTLSIPITKRNKKYLPMELSEIASSTMKSIDNKKDLSLEEKERIKAVGYKQAWIPTLYTTFNGEAKEVSLEDIKSLDEIKGLIKSTNYKKEDISQNTSQYNSNIEPQLLFPTPKEALKVLKANENYLLPYNHMGESIESLTFEILDRLQAPYFAITVEMGPSGDNYLIVTYFDKSENYIGDLSFKLDKNDIATEEICLVIGEKIMYNVDVIHFGQGF